MNTVVLVGYALFVAVMSLRSTGGAALEPWDKLLHLVTYGIFAVLAHRAIREKRRFSAALSSICAYSGLLELAQSYVPGRVMSGHDLAANMLGVATGAAAARWLDGGRGTGVE